MWRGPTAVSTEFGPTIGRSGDSPVSDGACSGLAVNSERTWSGWQVITGSPPIVPRIRNDVAEAAPGAEDELDLALVEAQHLNRARQGDRRRRRDSPSTAPSSSGPAGDGGAAPIDPSTAGPSEGRSWTRTTMTS